MAKRIEQPPEDPIEARAELERVLASEEFGQAPRLQKLLRYVVEETLAGNAASLKEYTLAIDVYERDTDFDPRTNSLVRVDAGRLRRRLLEHYVSAPHGSLRIEIPKGGYVAHFARVESRPSEATDDPESAIHRASIAVLPFRNLSGDPSQDFIGDGLSEEIVADLSRHLDVDVVGSAATRRLVESTRDVREIAKEVGAVYVLDGSVRRAGDRLRLNAQLSEGPTARTLWANAWDRDYVPEHVLDIQTEIGELVAAALTDLHGVLTRASFARARPSAAAYTESYESVLRFYDYRSAGTREQHRGVKKAIKVTLEREPDYAQAWAVLAWLELDEPTFDYGAEKERASGVDRAEAAAVRAVALDATNLLAHSAFIGIHASRNDLDQLERAAKRVLELNPSHPHALAQLGLSYAARGDVEQGLAFGSRAERLNPNVPIYRLPRAIHRIAHGDFEEALALVRDLQTGSHTADLGIAVCCGMLGRLDEAKAALERIGEKDPGFLDDPRAGLARMWVRGPIADQLLEGLARAGLATAQED